METFKVICCYKFLHYTKYIPSARDILVETEEIQPLNMVQILSYLYAEIKRHVILLIVEFK